MFPCLFLIFLNPWNTLGVFQYKTILNMSNNIEIRGVTHANRNWKLRPIVFHSKTFWQKEWYSGRLYLAMMKAKVPTRMKFKIIKLFIYHFKSNRVISRLGAEYGNIF